MRTHVRVRNDGLVQRIADRLARRRPAPLGAPAFTEAGEDGIISGLRAIRATTATTIASIGVRLAQVLGRPLSRLDRAISRCRRREARIGIVEVHLADAAENLLLMEAELRREAEQTGAPVDRRLPTWVLLLGLLGITVFDTPVNSTVFQAFAESQTLTRILAAGFSFALVVIGHSVGDELHARKYQQQHLSRHRASLLLVFGAIALLAMGLAGSADLRSVFFATQGLEVPLLDVLAIQVAVFGSAVLLSYLHANRLLDQVDHWRRVVRRDERRRHRRHRAFARAFARMRRAWHRGEQLLREYLSLVDAHVSTCVDQQWRWVNENGGVAVLPGVADQVREPDLPDWVEHARDHRLLTESADEAVTPPRLDTLLARPGDAADADVETSAEAGDQVGAAGAGGAELEPEVDTVVDLTDGRTDTETTEAEADADLAPDGPLSGDDEPFVDVAVSTNGSEPSDTADDSREDA